MTKDPAKAAGPIFQKVSDYLIGLGLIIKAIDKLKHFDRSPLLVGFLFLAGILIIVGATFHERIEQRIRNFSAFYHLLEGLALIAVAIIILESGPSRIPYFLFFLGAVYLILGAARLAASDKNWERVRTRLRFFLGFAFLAAAATTLALNAVFVRIIWMYVMAAALIAGAMIILLAGKGAPGRRGSIR